MSTKLPLQSRAIRPKFQNRKAIFGDDEDEEEKVNEERILGIEDNKVKEAEPKKEVAPLSITPLPNVDWRASAKHKKELFLPEQAKQPANGMMDTKPEVLEQSASSFGLQIQKKKHIEVTDEHGNKESVTVEETTTLPKAEDANAPKTLEERAIEAIIKDSLGQGNNEDDDKPKKVIAADETSIFRDDYENRPDETSMEDYEKIPVDEFGAALLRGLGWNEGEGIGRNRKNAPAPPPAPVKQREALLGLGAKPEEVDVKDERQKFRNRREAFEYKDTSLFKKISKRKVEDSREHSSSSSSSRKRSREHSSRDGSRERSSSSSSSSRKRSRERSSRDRSSERSSRKRSRERHSSSSSRRRSRERGDNSSSRRRSRERSDSSRRRSRERSDNSF